jgi:hypothetical protein
LPGLAGNCRTTDASEPIWPPRARPRKLSTAPPFNRERRQRQSRRRPWFRPEMSSKRLTGTPAWGSIFVTFRHRFPPRQNRRPHAVFRPGSPRAECPEIVFWKHSQGVTRSPATHFPCAAYFP